MNRPFHIRVECYAGFKGDERPQRFVLADQRYEVTDVQDQWYGPDCIYFRVRADDGNLYLLRHTDRGQEDAWTLVESGFRDRVE